MNIFAKNRKSEILNQTRHGHTLGSSGRVFSHPGEDGIWNSKQKHHNVAVFENPIFYFKIIMFIYIYICMFAWIYIYIYKIWIVCIYNISYIYTIYCIWYIIYIIYIYYIIYIDQCLEDEIWQEAGKHRWWADLSDVASTRLDVTAWPCFSTCGEKWGFSRRKQHSHGKITIFNR